MTNNKMKSLGAMRVGDSGNIGKLDAAQVARLSVSPYELERRLLEMGFIEGASIKILHQGLIGGDPIAVQVNEARVAIRRNEAHAVLIAAA